jgi:glutamate-1-semialdehyde aminotransferase
VKTAGAGAVAAVIVEPMQGTAGQRDPAQGVPARGAFDGRRHLGALLITDEMITGLGVRGSAGGPTTPGVRPDVVTIGKAFGGGFPLSGPADDRRDLGGEAVGQPVGIVVQLRRQPAGRGGRARRR